MTNGGAANRCRGSIMPSSWAREQRLVLSKTVIADSWYDSLLVDMKSCLPPSQAIVLREANVSEQGCVFSLPLQGGIKAEVSEFLREGESDNLYRPAAGRMDFWIRRSRE